MQRVGTELRLSATDLVGHLACAHLTELELQAATGAMRRPHFEDEALEALWERGRRHEAEYVATLEAGGFQPVRIGGVGVDPAFVAQTVAAMRAGARLIVQGALQSGRWVGRPDVLKRVDRDGRPADGGAWPWLYEPIDAKLARETRAGAVLQLCLYAALLEAEQGEAPERIAVVAPWTEFQERPFRVAEFAAYFRRARRTLEGALERRGDPAAYPDPVDHCDVCVWSGACEAQRRADDHLSLVAGARPGQIRELQAHGVTTMAALAGLPTPLPWKPQRGARESYDRLIRQARIQVRGRQAGQILHELAPVEQGFGLTALPEPSEGDVFLDFEGDPFIGPDGLEYLFGYIWRADGAERGVADWALTRLQERRAFERFIDFVTERRARWGGLHVYHYAPYEPAALKRLAGRHATRQDELDALLRGKVFVDLFAVVRRALIASVESYSIKKLEPLFGLERAEPLRSAGRAKARLEAALELEEPAAIEAADRAAVESYNRDDCISALALRDWLETERAGLIATGPEVPRPAPEAGETPENVAVWLEKIEPVIARLLEGVPEEAAERTPAEQGRWLTAHLLDWHRREAKSVWWEYFRLADLETEDLIDERAAIAGLDLVEEVPPQGKKRTPLHRYRFPAQECQVREGDELRAKGGERLGTVDAIDLDGLTIDIRKRDAAAGIHPEAVFAHTHIRIDVLQESLLALGHWVADHGLGGAGPWRAARALIARAPLGAPAHLEGEELLDAACRLTLDPAVSVLPIQGPPGSGKTWLGARLICRLVAEGKTVAVTANSHKVIRKLLDDTLTAAGELGRELRCVQKTDKDDLGPEGPGLKVVGDNADLFGALDADCRVGGGTVWLWAREEAAGCADVLVVDEAAQMQLANVLAASRCAETLVLLGDPQQLDQPVQGKHPQGCEVSALRHILGEAETIPEDRGLFLPQTRRLHPAICAFTSELFYEGKLQPLAGLERQELRRAGRGSGAGLKFLGVAHQGNQSASAEEADAVAALVAEVLADGPTWIDGDGVEAPLGPEGILVISPYNAQVLALKRALPDGVQVGTVDKFQGQEAPLVVYSLASSSQADAPRGMDFLYSLNRLNVATSRARCVSVLVASPEVFAARCRTVEQMRLANAFCRYLELAEAI